MANSLAHSIIAIGVLAGALSSYSGVKITANDSIKGDVNLSSKVDIKDCIDFQKYLFGQSNDAKEECYIGISKPEMFGYVAGCCPAPGIVPAQDSMMVHPGTIQESDFKIDKDKMPYLLMITDARFDGVVGDFPEAYHNLFTKNGTDYIWQVIADGDHGGNSIRPHMYNYLQAIFKAK